MPTTRILIIVFSLIYIAGFGAYFVSQGDMEFLWYVAVMVGFGVFVASTLKKTQFPDWILGGLSLWGLLHMAGGGVKVGEGVLYAWKFLPIYQGADPDFMLFKYDQAVHFYGFAITALAVHFLLRKNYPTMSVFNRASLATLTSMGLSVVNEIAEFLALIFIAETGVGGFYNLELDLVFNTLGAVTAVIVAEIVLKYFNK
jgi:uncharacterized membrane protein YjdF